MYIAFRDDDTSYFTKPAEIEKAYDFLEEDECVSLSIVPKTVTVHKNNIFPYDHEPENGYFDIENNKELIKWLKRNIESGKVDPLLHGYSHEYKKIKDVWVPEMKWKDKERLEKELIEGKEHIEKLLGCNLKVFVAPNNAIDKKAISIVEKMNMDYSGIIMINDRKKNLRYFLNLVKRWTIRLIYGIPYPGILNYGKHKELVAYTVDSYERLVYEYERCKKKKQPFVVYSHYWVINKHSEVRESLKKIYKYAKEDGAEVVPLSECFK